MLGVGHDGQVLEAVIVHDAVDVVDVLTGRQVLNRATPGRVHPLPHQPRPEDVAAPIGVRVARCPNQDAALLVNNSAVPVGMGGASVLRAERVAWLNPTALSWAANSGRQTARQGCFLPQGCLTGYLLATSDSTSLRAPPLTRLRARRSVPVLGGGAAPSSTSGALLSTSSSPVAPSLKPLPHDRSCKWGIISCSFGDYVTR